MNYMYIENIKFEWCESNGIMSKGVNGLQKLKELCGYDFAEFINKLLREGRKGEYSEEISMHQQKFISSKPTSGYGESSQGQSGVLAKEKNRK